MEKEKKIRLENLIKSKQDVFPICNGDYYRNHICFLQLEYNKLKCCYRNEHICSYQKIENSKGYN